MKKAIKLSISVLLAIVVAMSLVSCGKKLSTDELWANALYTEDTQLGNGEKTVEVSVEVSERIVNFTIKTDKETVGEALFEHGLVQGEDGQFGLYIKKVNGITADYDVDGSYWAFYIDGEYAMTGVDGTQISEGTQYKLIYEK